MNVFLPLLLAIANGIALAQGPIVPDLAPLKYKLLFENDKVRVIEEHLKPREKEPMHSHPYGVFACFDHDRAQIGLAGLRVDGALVAFSGGCNISRPTDAG